MTEAKKFSLDTLAFFFNSDGASAYMGITKDSIPFDPNSQLVTDGIAFLEVATGYRFVSDDGEVIAPLYDHFFSPPSCQVMVKKHYSSEIKEIVAKGHNLDLNKVDSEFIQRLYEAPPESVLMRDYLNISALITAHPRLRLLDDLYKEFYTNMLPALEQIFERIEIKNIDSNLCSLLVEERYENRCTNDFNRRCIVVGGASMLLKQWRQSVKNMFEKLAPSGFLAPQIEVNPELQGHERLTPTTPPLEQRLTKARLQAQLAVGA